MANNTRTTITRLLTGFAALSALVLSAQLPATEATTARTTRSIGYIAGTIADESTRDGLLEQVEADIQPALLQQGFRPESGPVGIYVENIGYSSGNVSIYSADTLLISDFDNDGFYHRFSVTFDADTVNTSDWIYAELYLSYEGGPWNFYATTDSFTIHGESANDAYTIETELADGIPAGYYDIRIELYDAHDNSWLLGYGPYEDASLSALPLEDSWRDDTYTSVGYTTDVIVHGSGAFDPLVLALFPLILLARSVQRSANRHRDGESG